MIFHDIEQNTDEWCSMRAGRVTSSNLSKIMANYGKAFGDPAKNYALQIAVERVTGKPVSSGYNNEHMERGHEEEPLARVLYEQQMFCEVTNGGFYCNEATGCSPDGLVGDNGVVEIKSAIAHVHLERVIKQSFDTAYKWQLIGNMYFPEKEWIDFISYCSSFPEGKKLYVKRLYAEDYQEEFKMIDGRLSDFFELVSEAESDLKNKVYINTERN